MANEIAIRLLAIGVLALAPALVMSAGNGSSVAFFVNDQNDYDYAQLTSLPPTFGVGQFTLEVWIRPDVSFPIGSTACCEGQRLNWSDADLEPYSGGSWWFAGNFLLDGHNNSNFAAGTFTLQFYAGGRVRWLFGDGSSPVGGVLSVGAYPGINTATLRDGNWHHLTLVRRWSGKMNSQLELWVDGALVGTEMSTLRTNMQAAYWTNWVGFPAAQPGWFWGAEKQAALGILSQYEDYKGPVDELRFWDRAKSAAEIGTAWQALPSGMEPGLVGWFQFEEGAGNTTCDSLDAARCMDLINMKPGYWSVEHPPLVSAVFASGFE